MAAGGTTHKQDNSGIHFGVLEKIFPTGFRVNTSQILHDLPWKMLRIAVAMVFDKYVAGN